MQIFLSATNQHNPRIRAKFRLLLSTIAVLATIEQMKKWNKLRIRNDDIEDEDDLGVLYV